MYGILSIYTSLFRQKTIFVRDRFCFESLQNKNAFCILGTIKSVHVKKVY